MIEKRGKMNAFIKTLILFVLFVSGCNETPTSTIDTIVDNDEVYITEKDALRISASIFDFKSNIPQAGYDSASVYVKSYKNLFDDVVRAKIESGGKFIVEIPKPFDREFTVHYPKNHTAYNIDSTSSHTFVDSIKFTNPTEFTRYYFGATIYYNDLSENGNYISSSINKARMGNYDSFPNEEDSYFLFYYFKNSTTISGYQKFIDVGIYRIREIITNYNIEVNQGWNVFECKYILKEGNNIDGGKFILNVVNTENNSGSWIYHGAEIFPTSVYDL